MHVADRSRAAHPAKSRGKLSRPLVCRRPESVGKKHRVARQAVQAAGAVEDRTRQREQLGGLAVLAALGLPALEAGHGVICSIRSGSGTTLDVESGDFRHGPADAVTADLL